MVLSILAMSLFRVSLSSCKPANARFIYHENPGWPQPNNLAMLSLCQPICQFRQPRFVKKIHLTDIRRIAKGSGGHAGVNAGLCIFIERVVSQFERRKMV